MTLSVDKIPLEAGLGFGSHIFDILPGKSEEYIMTHRMSSNAVGVAIPEIGRNMMHQEVVELIKA